ncbi:hypothetical protein DH2020_000316 [Rehmannia glutinosa]|uniref:40S ribosomal protein S30 n=1 Tax=Rehmannia glutinosa TaxID=99300 RepID=A0ABR0XW60_REHGL
MERFTDQHVLGKVRGQTLSVAERQEEEARGRAHKRMQYNRRFVTAVVAL